jgi:excisionase family DNA binding protein
MENNQIIGISIDELQRIMKGVVRGEIESLLQTPVTGSGFSEELWDRKQAANFLGISEQTLVKLVLEERIIAQKSGRKYHFLKSSVMNFLKGKLNN